MHGMPAQAGAKPVVVAAPLLVPLLQEVKLRTHYHGGDGVHPKGVGQAVDVGSQLRIADIALLPRRVGTDGD